MNVFLWVKKKQKCENNWFEKSNTYKNFPVFEVQKVIFLFTNKYL